MKWFDEYRSSLKMIEVEELLDLIFYRPLAFVFVKLVYPTDITPNQISLVALLFGVAGGLFFSFGTHISYIVAAILLILYDVLDCSDGQLARLKQNGTLIGRIIDGFSDYVVAVVAYICIGIGFSLQSGDPLYAWSLTVLAGVSNAIHSIILDYYRNVFMDNVLRRENTLGDSLEKFEEEYKRLQASKGYHYETLLLWFYLKYSSLQIRFAPQTTTVYDSDDYYHKNKRILHFWTYLGPTSELTFMIVCALVNRMDIYLWGLIVAGNLYAIILYLFQVKINKSLKLLEIT
jgi:hypothetical protein